MRRRKKRLNIQPKLVLRICLFLCAVMMFFTFRYKETFNPAKTALGNVITPMQKGINTIGSYITGKLDIFQSIIELTKDNEDLQAQVDSLKMMNNSLASDLYELESLRALYSVGEKYSDYPMVAASIISKELNSYYNIFTIDKGAKDGIAVNMNILAGNGLAGIVIEVGENHSKIRTIIDDSSYVSGMFPKTQDTCDIKGDLELLDSGYIRAESINIDADIKDDYEIVTSHISDKYLPGILIGYVCNIEVDSSNMSKKAYIRPVVDFEHLKEVLVITQLKVPLEDLPDENSYEYILDKAKGLSSKDKEKLAEEMSKLVEEASK